MFHAQVQGDKRKRSSAWLICCSMKIMRLPADYIPQHLCMLAKFLLGDLVSPRYNCSALGCDIAHRLFDRIPASLLVTPCWVRESTDRCISMAAAPLLFLMAWLAIACSLMCQKASYAGLPGRHLMQFFSPASP